MPMLHQARQGRSDHQQRYSRRTIVRSSTRRAGSPNAELAAPWSRTRCPWIGQHDATIRFLPERRRAATPSQPWAGRPPRAGLGDSFQNSASLAGFAQSTFRAVHGRPMPNAAVTCL